MSTLRILFTVHHPLDPNTGVSGATVQLAAALRARGCETEFFSFDDAFRGTGGGVGRMLAFPWKVARHLRRHAAAFDVIDATTGDAWRWLDAGRPGGAKPVVITRSHGLEHWAHRVRLERAARGELGLSWKYGLYHGGWRLREVERSIRAADGTIFLNQRNCAWAVREWRLPPERVAVLPNALPDALLGLPAPAPRRQDTPLEVAVLGAWIPSKGCRVIAAAAHELERRNVTVRWHLLGTHHGAERIAAEFPSAAARLLRVTPRYERAELPGLLASAHCFASGSWSEGFNMSLVETMACGLVPVTADVGAADTWVTPDVGELLPGITTAADLADALERLNTSPDLDMRRQSAQRAVQGLTWSRVADDTLAFYARCARRPLSPP